MTEIEEALVNTLVDRFLPAGAGLHATEFRVADGEILTGITDAVANRAICSSQQVGSLPGDLFIRRTIL